MNQLYILILLVIPVFVSCSQLDKNDCMTLNFFAIRSGNKCFRKHLISDKGISLTQSTLLADGDFAPIYNGTLQLNSTLNQPDTLEISTEKGNDLAKIKLNSLSSAIIETLSKEIAEYNKNNSSIPHLPVTMHLHNKQWIRINITEIIGDRHPTKIGKYTLIGIGLFGIGVIVIYFLWKRHC